MTPSGRSRAGATTVILLAFVGVILFGPLGYLLGNRTHSDAGVQPPRYSTEVAVVTVLPGAPSEGERTYSVDVAAAGLIAEVILLAAGEEVARLEPDGNPQVLRTAFATAAEGPIGAVVVLVDGRTSESPTVSTRSQSTDFEARLGNDGVQRDTEAGLVDANPDELPILRPRLATAVNWEGPARIVGGLLQVDDPGVSRVFAYVSGDGVDWHRIPAGAGESLALVDGVADVAGRLPALASRSLTVELWRDDTEVNHLGFATATLPADLETASAMTEIGLTGRLELGFVAQGAFGRGAEVLVESAVLPSVDAADEMYFRWQTDIPGVTHVLWQAFPNSPAIIGPPSPTDLGVARSGISEVSSGGLFRFVPPDRDQSAVSSGDPTDGTAAISQWMLNPTRTAGQVVADGPLANALPLGGAIPLPKDGVTSWTVRALAFSGDEYLDIASNPVVVRLPILEWSGLLLPTTNYTIAASADSVAAVDPRWQRCFDVVGIDPTVRADAENSSPEAALQYAILDSLLTHGSVLCLNVCYHASVSSDLLLAAYPGFSAAGVSAGGQTNIKIATGTATCDSGGGFLDVVGAFGTAVWEVAGVGYDLVESTYNGAVKLVKKAVLELSGCKQLAGAVADQSDADSLCAAAASIAVDAALMSVGLPPSLPDREKLIQNAKGDLAALLVQLATDQGVPCEELAAASDVIDTKGLTCEQIADKIVEEASEQLADAVRANARNQGMPFPPGVSVIQDTRATPDLLPVTITTIAESDLPPGRTCDAQVHAFVKWTPSAHPSVPFVGALYAEPRPFALAGSAPWAIPYREYVGAYRAQGLRLARPAAGETTASTTVYLELAGGAFQDVVAFRDRPSPFAGADPIRDQWNVAGDVVLQRPGAKINVTVVSDCAGLAFADTTVHFGSLFPGGTG